MMEVQSLSNDTVNNMDGGTKNANVNRTYPKKNTHSGGKNSAKGGIKGGMKKSLPAKQIPVKTNRPASRRNKKSGSKLKIIDRKSVV